jgi:rhodanese-related sulfurtransferase
MTASITPLRLAVVQQTTKSIDLIDIRTPAEYRELHVAFARNVPLDRLDPAVIASDQKGEIGQPL